MEISTESGLGDESDRCRHGSPQPLDTRLWGKERSLEHPYPVVCHLVDTGAYFAELWESVVGPRMRARVALALGLSETDAARELALWAALHDVGKISPSYQNSLSNDEAVRQKYPGHFEQLLSDGRYRHGTGGTDNGAGPHSRITHWTLPGILEQLGYPQGGPDGSVGDQVGHAIGQLLGGHHGNFHPRMERRQLRQPTTFLPQVGRGDWPEQRLRHVRVLRTLITNDGPVPTGILPAELSVVVLGAVMVADWLASNTQLITAVRRREDEECCCDVVLARHWKRAREAARTGTGQRALGRCVFAAPKAEKLVSAAGFPADSVHDRLARQLLATPGPTRAGMLLVSAPAGPDRRRLGLVAASWLGRASGARGIALALAEELHLDEAVEELTSLAGTVLEGAGLLTRLHPMSFDSDPESASEEIPELSLGAHDLALARRWLTERRRGLLASLGVGVLDQFLPAVLPVPDNAVRLFALSEKVLVVDGVRPQKPRSHHLLCLLVEWLAALGASVVLLTDALAGASADRLVRAYRRGARLAKGLRSREEDAPAPAELPHPGWLFVDGPDGPVPGGPVTHPDDQVPHLSVCEVRPRSGGADPYVEAVVRQAGDGGSALVCCSSVEEVQQTFRELEDHRRRYPAPGELRILHHRFRRFHVRDLVAECTAAHKAPARDGSVLVTTPAYAEHLPFRFDRVITRLAPMPSLLARASRGRHLVLLASDERTGSPMDRALAQRTLQVLRSHGPRLRLPSETGELIRSVYDSAGYMAALDGVSAEWHRRLVAADGEEAGAKHDANLISIPPPVDVHGDLYALTRAERGLTERRLAVAMGFEQAYVLFVRLQGTTAFLAPSGDKVPCVGPKEKRSEAVAVLARHAIPVPPSWAPRGGISEQIGRGRFDNIKYKHWVDRPWLNRVYPVVLSGTGDSCTGILGGMRLGLTNVGLVRLS
ncbi:CRISPR-associated endonuclease Cas3'' [Streptomyces sp. SL13]|uniref:CRISPR-associated endonuclease Cas3 n=1 Tax=Streptantibioticus silvisoli TaxID=2705255 RepID=A0AA90JW59_9ACTN|nr:CRISPR-associated endonuclease Cas3'' [Streptantibioticus silvisoli]MDI5968606.1 CRISPR-associated endonuclease Cas3'' [Streptantibioticus silvisoli]